MTPIQPQNVAPAKRMVLVVADGLRADKLFENRLERAPYLRDVVLHQGTWGVSHTRVPTESRPGHVALIAGFYEDVSAVTKGWKMNPVNFDSVFNQSTHTWSFGSPDILPMFAEGASDPNKVETIMYPAESEDFSADASKLDTWVFEKLLDFFKEAERNSTLKSMLRRDGIVIFLHLLGLDTNGHAFRPYSEEYLRNIRLVDDGLKEVIQVIDKFYGNDGKTAHIFTADHGMSNRGNHGDGHPDNTQTPLIAWGAGVAKPERKVVTGHDQLSATWDLHDLRRLDVEQADIAPLMSSLIGLPYPVNSVGVIPLSYLAASDHEKAIALAENAKQILAQFLIKSESKRRSEPFFKPFEPLKEHRELVAAVDAMIAQERIEEATATSRELIDKCIQGLRYFQTYDWLFLRSVIALGYAGWVAYSTLFMIRGDVLNESSKGKRPVSLTPANSVYATSILVSLGLGTLLYQKESPLLYYIYAAFPIFFWSETIKQRALVADSVAGLRSRGTTKSVAAIAAYALVLELLVYSYFRREVLAPSLWFLGLVWPWTFPAGFRQKHFVLLVLWAGSCLATSVFPLLPVEKGDSVLLVAAGGIVILISGLYGWLKVPYYADANLPGSADASRNRRSSKILGLEIVIAASIMVTVDTTYRLQAKSGLPLLNQTISWAILAIAIAIPILDGVHKGQHFLRRLVIIYLSFAPVFVLLSISYEVLFYACFSMTLLCWLLVEKALAEDVDDAVYSEGSVSVRATGKEPPSNRSLGLSDLRIAGTFLLFINVAFFGTGNIASVSSFSLESVYRFTTVFNPFLMGALLIFKILIPFFLLSSIFTVLGRILRLPPFSLFCLVLSTTDIMTLNFFFLVKDYGSWLEIGTTISHFVIASAFIVFQIVLFGVSYGLVGGVLVPDVKRVRGKKDK
ncbi:Phosphatidylinositolglycan class N-domain-containing protein [Fimicolochytrium jonesii]|uniref:Phosphatidylinositolglycan class N-domain-containing protein n=1 Tax=Fimicolochytrium jonesii TaxID=1396493 RepID=UPI0022FDD863|nr:Phosphatidylinositolglycan class N-domain-containing protein [Fimicolochytrium jonesii]KAI8822461.1 Phosphatidylinositolglycan class N-domain-containing protein [Fimicolochytrium jonesii]